jgi:hypothetical protein
LMADRAWHPGFANRDPDTINHKAVASAYASSSTMSKPASIVGCERDEQISFTRRRHRREF